MSIMIIMIHTGFTPQMPILRTAVPVFFIISSYLFFHKIHTIDKNQIKLTYKKFLLRASKLYLFWFIVFFPVTYKVRHLGEMELLSMIKTLIMRVFLQSTFPGSWYISAYVIGISIALILKNYNKCLCILGILSYLFCCLISNYGNVYYIQNFNWGGIDWENSFLAGIIFVFIGKILAETDNRSLTIGIIGIIIGYFLLHIESEYVAINCLRKADDCYLSLMILAPGIFITTLALPNSIKSSTLYIRNMSTIYYCSHISLLHVLHAFLGDLQKTVLLVTVIILCTILSLVLIGLSKFRYLHWLKYSY